MHLVFGTAIVEENVCLSFAFERGFWWERLRDWWGGHVNVPVGPQLCVFKAHHGFKSHVVKGSHEVPQTASDQSIISSVLLSEHLLARTQQAEGTILSCFLCFETKAVSEMANLTSQQSQAAQPTLLRQKLTPTGDIY